jgi:hypothetical protein
MYAMPGVAHRPVDNGTDKDPVRTAEDDGLRSKHMCSLVQRPAPTKSRPGAPEIPRVIVQF